MYLIPSEIWWRSASLVLSAGYKNSYTWVRGQHRLSSRVSIYNHNLSKSNSQRSLHHIMFYTPRFLAITTAVFALAGLVSAMPVDESVSCTSWIFQTHSLTFPLGYLNAPSPWRWQLAVRPEFDFNLNAFVYWLTATLQGHPGSSTCPSQDNNRCFDSRGWRR